MQFWRLASKAETCLRMRTEACKGEKEKRGRSSSFIFYFSRFFFVRVSDESFLLSLLLYYLFDKNFIFETKNSKKKIWNKIANRSECVHRQAFASNNTHLMREQYETTEPDRHISRVWCEILIKKWRSFRVHICFISSLLIAVWY